MTVIVVIVVVVATRDPHRQAEGLRAALGVTLRGADVTAVTSPPLTPLARRSIETLVPFGHRVVDALALDGAEVVEIWTGPEPVAFPVTRGARRILHVIRGTAPPEGAVASDDDLVYLSGVAPDRPEAAAVYDRIVALAFANELVVTW